MTKVELLDGGERMTLCNLPIATMVESTGDKPVVANSYFQTDALESYLTVTNLR